MKNEKKAITNAKEVRQNKLNVPTLRFRDFSDSWVLTPIKKLLRFQNGINAESTKYGKGIKYISVSDILNNQYITYDCIKGLIDIDEKTLKKFIVEYGDILFQRSSETFEDIGRANVYLDKERPATFGGFVIRGKKISNYNPLFFRYLLCTHNARKQTVRMGAGAQHYNIGQDGLEKISLFFPSLPEQDKIAYFIDCLDERIATQNKIISKYESLIKGLIDHLLVTNDDKLYSFKDLYEKAGEGGTPATDKKDFYKNGDIPFIKIDDLLQKYIVENSDFITSLGLVKSSAWLVPANSVIFSNGATIGRISINTYPIATKQGVLGIVPSRLILTEYLYYYMKSAYFRKQVRRITVKGTMDCAYLKDLNTIACYIPEKAIQEKRLNLLSALDEKISSEKEYLKKLKEQKKYLLSKMFI
ncbi:MAG: restriction endonuclease subunit S [Clostridiales bacterium]|nr:restriction endonuclease subunit S [Clostridiales bacterium]